MREPVTLVSCDFCGIQYGTVRFNEPTLLLTVDGKDSCGKCYDKCLELRRVSHAH